METLHKFFMLLKAKINCKVSLAMKIIGVRFFLMLANILNFSWWYLYFTVKIGLISITRSY